METGMLESFGLTRNEARVYTALLQEGATSAGRITEATGIHRRNVYDCLERLMERGLVGFVTMNQRKLFEAADPKRFLGIIEEERGKLLKQEKAVQALLPQLEAVQKLKGRVTSEISYFKGKEGVKTVFEDILATGRDYVGYGLSYEMETLLRPYLLEFVKRKEKKGMRSRMIYDRKGSDIVRSRLSAHRFSLDRSHAPQSVRVYGNKVALMLLSTEQPYAIVIDHRQTAERFRKRFAFLWKSAKP